MTTEVVEDCCVEGVHVLVPGNVGQGSVPQQEPEQASQALRVGHGSLNRKS